MSDSVPVATLHSLARSDALTQFQADELIRLWPELDEGWASHPYFRSIREHTRAFIGAPAPRNRHHDLATVGEVS